MSELNEKLLSDIQELLKLYEENGPYYQNTTVNDEAVKTVITKMIDFIIPDKTSGNRLLDWMTSHEFFTGPASGRYHANVKGGLAMHSLMVTRQALSFAPAFLSNFNSSKNAEKYQVTASDIFIAAMCHDFCKTGFYSVEHRKTKDYNGNWTYEPYYKPKADNRNLGHGNESVLLLLESMPELLGNRTVLEAISRHMGFSDLSENESYNYSNFLQNPLVLLIQAADQSAAQWWDW